MIRSTLRPPPLPTDADGHVLDVVPVALRELVERTVAEQLTRVYATAFVIGGLGALCGSLSFYALLTLGAF